MFHFRSPDQDCHVRRDHGRVQGVVPSEAGQTRTAALGAGAAAGGPLDLLSSSISACDAFGKRHPQSPTSQSSPTQAQTP